MEYTVSEKLKIIMDRHDVTFTELAERIGQSRQNVSLKFSKGSFTINDLKSDQRRIRCRIKYRF